MFDLDLLGKMSGRLYVNVSAALETLNKSYSISDIAGLTPVTRLDEMLCGPLSPRSVRARMMAMIMTVKTG